MSEKSSSREPVRFERSYEATLDEVWSLWTTAEGFEAWWGPQGFRVAVHALEARVGGALRYDMIASRAEEIAFMERAGMPLSHPVAATITECVPPSRLTICSVIDFVPGVEPYENNLRVELFAVGSQVRMVVTVDAHVDDAWTQRASAGMESQLTKVDDALRARRA